MTGTRVWDGKLPFEKKLVWFFRFEAKFLGTSEFAEFRNDGFVNDHPVVLFFGGDPHFERLTFHFISEVENAFRYVQSWENRSVRMVLTQRLRPAVLGKLY